MTGGVAHDFNNLMAVVASGLRLIRGRIDNEEVRRIAIPRRPLLNAEPG